MVSGVPTAFQSVAALVAAASRLHVHGHIAAAYLVANHLPEPSRRGGHGAGCITSDQQHRGAPLPTLPRHHCERSLSGPRNVVARVSRDDEKWQALHLTLNCHRPA